MKAWIAKDRDGVSYLHFNKPFKAMEAGIWSGDHPFAPIEDNDIPVDIFPQWKDSEPIEVEINITKAKEE